MIFRLKSVNWLKKKADKKTSSDSKREELINVGREQFERLIKRGMSIPVAFL